MGEKQAELGPPDVSSRGRGRANPTAKGKWAVKIPTGCAHQHDSHSQEPPATQNYSFPVEFHLLITDLQEMGPHFTGESDGSKSNLFLLPRYLLGMAL